MSSLLADVKAAAGRLQERLLAAYQWPTLAAAVAVMLWTRLQSWRDFYTEAGVLYRGTDAWYHYRHVQALVENYPHGIRHDPLTNYPHGATAGQFGTLFDQAIAAIALLAGAGNPSSDLTALVLLVAPAVLGAAVALPVYVLARRLRDRFAGTIAVIVLALFPGTFLTRTLVATSDHNAAEPLLFTCTVLAFAFAHTRRQNHADTALWAVIAGLALSAYLYTWPPAVLLFGIYGGYVLWQLTADVLEDTAPTQTTIVAGVAMATTTAFALARVETLAWSASDYGLLQPSAAGLVTVGALAAGALAAVWRTRDDAWTYPVVLATVGAVGVAVAGAVAPTAVATVVAAARQFVFFGSSASVGIAEALPYPAIADNYGLPVSTLVAFEYGVTWLAGALVAASFLYRSHVAHRLHGHSTRLLDAQERLVATVVLVLAAAGWTQIRFQYYLAPFIAVLAGVAATQARHLATTYLPADGDDRVSADAVFAVGLAIAVLVVPLAAPVVATSDQGQVTSPVAVTVGDQHEPTADLEAWHSHLQWLSSATPEPSLNASGVPSYGVLAWWDAGHWLTTIGERPAVANPMQQHRRLVATALLAPGEDAAIQHLHGGAQAAKYVVLDHQVLKPGSELSNVIEATGRDRSQYVLESTNDLLTSTRYERAFGVRLFENHGSSDGRVPALERYRLVATSEQRAPDGGAWVKTFEQVAGARLTGTAAANETVAVRVALETRWGTRFEYEQFASTSSTGRFEVRVPYATTGYDDGVAVRAVGPAVVSAGGASTRVAVPEGAVEDGRSIPTLLTNTSA